MLNEKILYNTIKKDIDYYIKNEEFPKNYRKSFVEKVNSVRYLFEKKYEELEAGEFKISKNKILNLLYIVKNKNKIYVKRLLDKWRTNRYENTWNGSSSK